MKYIIIIFYVKFDGESIGGNFKLIETILYSRRVIGEILSFVSPKILLVALRSINISTTQLYSKKVQ